MLLSCLLLQETKQTQMASSSQRVAVDVSYVDSTGRSRHHQQRRGRRSIHERCCCAAELAEAGGRQHAATEMLHGTLLSKQLGFAYNSSLLQLFGGALVAGFCGACMSSSIQQYQFVQAGVQIVQLVSWGFSKE